MRARTEGPAIQTIREEGRRRRRALRSATRGGAALAIFGFLLAPGQGEAMMEAWSGAGAAPAGAAGAGAAGIASALLQPADRNPELRSLPAVRIQGAAPVIDGRLDDPAWAQAPVARDFVQLEPSPGAPATERTEVRILYDDDALYVAFRAWDRSPDSIAAQLTRRGESSHSDRVHVLVDSYHDRRTAFHFTVNPRGVKSDSYRFDDTREDTGWSAVWDVATSVDEEGWTAEFRIPLSQLRYSGAPLQDWGINFARDVARRNETSVWAPFTPDDNAVVSRFGVLEGLRELPAGRRLELQPYTVTRLRRGPGDPANPFFRKNDASAEMGADLKLGITNNLTLDLTVNPDFGQVEADPAQVNLTAFETFLPERRPFFLEGSGIFRFGIGVGDGDGENQQLFYSRRIGRAPQGASPSGPGGVQGWVDRPGQTRILTAAKLSGKTEGGWSIGALHALTGSEEARFAGVDGSRSARTVEPLANASMLRLQRDFRGGQSAVGGIVTTLFRDADDAASLGLRDRAVTGGLDLRHRFLGGDADLRAYLLASHVAGSPGAILATQRSSARFYQRPDADHLTLDPEATSLSGLSGHLEFFKMGGGSWRFASITQFRTPGFEANDLGFMPQAGYTQQAGYVGYHRNRAGDRFRNWGVNTNAWSEWTSGWEHVNVGGNVNAQATLLNNWNGWMGVNANRGGLNPTLLRGGPALRTEPSFNGWQGIGSDGRRDLQASVSHNWSVRPASDSWSHNVSLNTRWRPSQRASVRMGPFVTVREEDRQWVSRITAGGEDQFLFARMEQTTVGMTARLDMAITPNLTLQFYGQPFLSTQAFGGFKVVEDPRAADYGARFRLLDATRTDTGWEADLNGDGSLEGFPAPDFRVAQFRSNAVLRWEYRPGSTLFVVWGQARDDAAPDGDFHLGEGMRGLFDRAPENVLMVKLSYWLTP
jgi:hypothetical protein